MRRRTSLSSQAGINERSELPDDLDAEVNRLERLAAESVQNVQGWLVMRDPVGLLFCVLPMSPGPLNGQNARRWE
jgi:hypothetical protein